MQIKQTKKLESVLLGGCYEARRRSSSEVTTDHLFLAILEQEGSGHASMCCGNCSKTGRSIRSKRVSNAKWVLSSRKTAGLRLSDRRSLSTANRCCAKSFPMRARAASWNTCSIRDHSHRQERSHRCRPGCHAEGVRENDHGQETSERRVQAAADGRPSVADRAAWR